MNAVRAPGARGWLLLQTLPRTLPAAREGSKTPACATSNCAAPKLQHHTSRHTSHHTHHAHHTARTCSTAVAKFSHSYGGYLLYATGSALQNICATCRTLQASCGTSIRTHDNHTLRQPSSEWSAGTPLPTWVSQCVPKVIQFMNRRRLSAPPCSDPSRR